MSAPRVVVLGGGRMGAGIAHAFLLAGSEVSVIERDDEQAASARDRVLDSVRTSIRRGATTESEAELARRLAVGATDEPLALSDLVVEAVPEDFELKVATLTRIEAGVRGAALIASNTSSMSIDDLAHALSDPGRFVGMHFFNPVPASTLVELVRGSTTRDGVVAEAQRLVALIGKTAVTVSDSPGFASSRLGVALGLEAIRMLEDGVASAADIDLAMTLGYKHPVGPLRLTDIVGLDVRLGIAEYLHQRLGERFEPPALLREKVAAGELGRKSGRGFFEWPSE